MKTRMYENLQVSGAYRKMASQMFGEIHDLAKEKYDILYKLIGGWSESRTGWGAAECQMGNILKLAKGSLEGRKILDLGCGSINSTGGEYSGPGRRGFEPWLCRAMHELGIDHLGIDVGGNPGEEFNFHQADLIQPGSLDFIGDHSIDIANASMFFSSPNLAGMPGNRRIWDNLLPQLERVVKQEGFFLYSQL
ncbi:hypothetical protein HOA55_01310 [archaeon]|jgi:hypothetical protein|nr:hypothetical protein [archaeon]MBT3578056.1 hypothetical protein [archaeon]MBT6819971.1 hypothetical protein [archaeon]MBT6956331.1 hypothetical protein [archaeon]MBT7025008.1 hypothetical protein [archaeon]